MNKEIEEKKEYIKENIHRIVVIARIMTEESDITEEDVRELISEVGNKEFKRVFGATEREFFMMAMSDLLRDSVTLAEMMKGEE